ncbi:MAG TPA: hypothetical protein EYH22_02020 [Candidatus Nanopusillus sp.]|nr:hypothetical protein [Candidatus Nanopusillus sp.]
MKNLFYIDQHKRFPEIANVVIVADKGVSAVPIYSYTSLLNTIFTKNRYAHIPFYVGVIPRTYDEEYIVPAFIYTEYKLPLFSLAELKPLFYLKFVLDTVYNAIVGVLVNDEYELSKEKVKRDISELFGVDGERLIIESEYKAKAYLIHTNKLFERNFIVIKKR